MSDWNPQQYLKFEKERTQPSIDLVSRISLEDPRTIIDIGCGPGNSTQILHKRWPLADIVGIDNSAAMIERARADYPMQQWEVRDAACPAPGRRYDIVFSSATLQWVPDHDVLMPLLFEMVNSNGILAIQVPANIDSPFFRIMLRVGANAKWGKYTAGCEKLLTYHTAEFYYNKLGTLTQDIDIWKTTYFHSMRSHRDLTAWHKSTGMRPFLDKLPDDGARQKFEDDIVAECEASYPVQSDGNILYLFDRLFLIAGKNRQRQKES